MPKDTEEVRRAVEDEFRRLADRAEAVAPGLAEVMRLHNQTDEAARLTDAYFKLLDPDPVFTILDHSTVETRKS